MAHLSALPTTMAGASPAQPGEPVPLYFMWGEGGELLVKCKLVLSGFVQVWRTAFWGCLTDHQQAINVPFLGCLG